MPPTLRQRSIVIEHICVEGWTYIGGWSGVPRRVFLEHIGADLCAKYVAFKMADDYPSSIDMADGAAPLDIPGYPVPEATPSPGPLGYPVCLRMATKLGIVIMTEKSVHHPTPS